MPVSPLRIALLQYRDARNVRNWSGTLHFSKQALGRHLGEVIDLSPAPPPLLPLRLARKLVQFSTGKMYSYDHDPALARWYGWYFGRKLRQVEADLIYAPAGSACVAHLETDLPILYFSDATWRLVHNYYPNFSNVIERTRRTGERLEQITLDRSAISLFSSEWAVESAVQDYGADPERTHNVLIGANLVDVPDAASAERRSIGSSIRLLFIGALWDVKGGAIAYDALMRLVELGWDATLTVVGCEPSEQFRHERVEVLGYLNKQDPEGRRRFEAVWDDADFFVLPSRCEAAGIVFCEAAAHGLPVLTTRTGGIPSIVVDGENGFTLPAAAGGAEYAERIAELANNAETYADLCRSSRKAFDQRLNWDRWGARVADIVCTTFPEWEQRVRGWQERQARAAAGPGA